MPSERARKLWEALENTGWGWLTNKGSIAAIDAALEAAKAEGRKEAQAEAECHDTALRDEWICGGHVTNRRKGEH